MDHLSKISSKYRKDTDYQFLKAECHYYLGRDEDLDPAIQAYSNAIELYESDPKSLEWFSEENMIFARSNLLECMTFKGINAIEKGDTSSIKKMSEKIIGMDLTLSDNYLAYLHIGGFLVSCYHLKDFLKTDEQYLLNAQTFSILKNYPNPFNGSTTIQYFLPSRSEIQLTIFDHLGREVKQLEHKFQEPGFHNINWDGREQYGTNVGSGIYLYRITYDGTTQTGKMLLVK